MSARRNLITALGAASCVILMVHAELGYAQSTYPEKPVRWIVGRGPGGSNDIVARLVAEKLAPALGQPVIVENRPGAGGVIAADQVTRAPADGYTILIIGTTETMQVALQPKLPYDLIKDFTPIALIGRGPMVLAVHPSMPVKTVRDFIQLARARPGQLNYGSVGVGSTNHLLVEMFRFRANIDVTHVPYKGSAQAVADLMGGHVDFLIFTPASLYKHVESGRLRALAVTTTQRSPFLSGLPTMAEAGVPGYAGDIWYGVVAPPKLHPAIVQRLNAELRNVLNTPELKKRLATDSISVTPGAAEELGQLMRAEITQWREVVKQGQIKPE
jgi:tripartite-type tricarboxylate transporter receptor subunit TctC